MVNHKNHINISSSDIYAGNLLVRVSGERGGNEPLYLKN